MILRGCRQLIVAFSYFTRQKMSSAHSKFVINGDFLQMYTKLASGIYSIGVLTGLTWVSKGLSFPPSFAAPWR